MKKLIYTFLAVSIIFATCKKEENNSSGTNGNNTSGSILGKWNLTQYEITSSEGYYTDYPNGKITTWDTNATIILPDINFYESIRWEFFNDHTMEEMMTEYGFAGVIDTTYYAWQKNGNILALDTHWALTINTLTANNLNWTSDQGEDTSSYSYYGYGGGDTVYFNREIGIASWNKVSGLSLNTSNARLKQNNRKEPSFFKKFINRRKITSY